MTARGSEGLVGSAVGVKRPIRGRESDEAEGEGTTHEEQQARDHRERPHSLRDDDLSLHRHLTSLGVLSDKLDEVIDRVGLLLLGRDEQVNLERVKVSGVVAGLPEEDVQEEGRRSVVPIHKGLGVSVWRGEARRGQQRVSVSGRTEHEVRKMTNRMKRARLAAHSKSARTT